MAEAAIPCSSGCAVLIRSIRDRWLPVKSRTERFESPGQDRASQWLAARLSFFTLRDSKMSFMVAGTLCVCR